MKPTSTTKTSAISDDAPTLTQTHFGRAKFRVNGKAATRTEWQDAARVRVGKERMSVMRTPPLEWPQST